jgi:hypothetical protein
VAFWKVRRFAMCAVGASLMATGSARTAAQTFSEVLHAAGGGQAVIVLSDARGQALVAVSPRLQGRVLATSAEGQTGHSLGWVNLEQIASGKVQKHFNPYGGEDRIWIAPEGGQFSVFFAPHSSFDLADWYTPAPFDTEPFDLVRKSRSSVALKKEFTLQNYAGTIFRARVDREIRLLNEDQVWRNLGIAPVSGLKMVAFESLNKLTNIGAAAWSKESGLLSIWILGQFPASSATTIVIPIHAGSESQLGTPVTSDYFGTVPATRLAVTPNAVYMRADAEYRGKLGVNPARATGSLGSYDAQLHILTIVQQSTPDPGADYVNNAWKIQDQPYKGDCTNAYNDGPQANGARLGHFYEMESLSPARALRPGESISHTQRTIHLEGDPASLDQIARKVLGVSLEQIGDALPGQPAASGSDE